MNMKQKLIHISVMVVPAICLMLAGMECTAQTSVVDGFQTSQVKNARVAAAPDDMFIDMQVQNHQIYLGEVLKVEYDVYVAASRGQVFYDVEEPEFARWYSVEGKAPQSGGVSLYGKSYTREPFAVYYLTPDSPGRLPLPVLKAQVPFIQAKPWITHDTRYIEVLTPPEPAPAAQ